MNGISMNGHDSELGYTGIYHEFYCHRLYGTRARRMTIATAVLYIFVHVDETKLESYDQGYI